MNSIAPGLQRDDNTETLLADATRNAAITARIPSGRWGEADELSGPAVCLVSPARD